MGLQVVGGIINGQSESEGSGVGYTWNRAHTGQYEISFTGVFEGLPAVVATGIETSSAHAGLCGAESISATSVTILTPGQHSMENHDFSFIAMYNS